MSEATLAQEGAKLCRQMDDMRRQISEGRIASQVDGDFPRSLTMRALMLTRPDLVQRCTAIVGILAAGVHLAGSIRHGADAWASTEEISRVASSRCTSDRSPGRRPDRRGLIDADQ